ncbi:MAG: gliding motility-associated C-terminal domain-containing protein [Flavobacteriaceae bacterium]|nr:gliding motility-associated C-terminal domain-containing protein [Flavobacteriaceae bacterium]
MSKLPFLIALFGLTMVSGQSGLYNVGAFRLHDGAAVGLHTDLVNNGSLEAETGSVFGFYGDRFLTVSGVFNPRLYDVELLNTQGISLLNSVDVTNNFNFILGRVDTPRNTPSTVLGFSEIAFYNGESDTNHIDGYAAITDKSEFVFPVGDAGQLRSLTLNSGSVNDFASCAYFFEDPSNPDTLSERFDTEERVRDIGEVSSVEFWVLDATRESTVTLSWNGRSDLQSIALELDDIFVVGWSKTANQWVMLGNTAAGGDLNEGFITSDSFIPSEFAAITFGSVPLPLDTFAVNNPTLGNYFMSPNGDGINENLIFDELEGTGRNQVAIFTRTGQKVFEQTDYTNEFRGEANVNGVILNREIGLPEGIYYYTISLLDEGLEYQGFVFLGR